MAPFVVTGAASGIGRATAELLRGQGREVVGVDLAGADIAADLGTPEGRRAAVAAIADRSEGVVAGVVPCAGLGPIPDRPGSLIVSVNHFGTVELLEGLQPYLAAHGAAAVVAISSNSTTCAPGVPMDLVDMCTAGDETGARARADELDTMAGVYPASKIAVARWVRRHAVTDDWVGAGIRLNAVAPGMIETAMVAEGRADATVGPLLDLFPIPLGRPGTAEEIAEIIGFLLGPAAALLCGSIVFADGGTDALLRPDDWPAAWNPGRPA